ncbi:MAG: DotH/IcmK family type IV secretion protein [Alphaproteobacteria bacterium]
MAGLFLFGWSLLTGFHTPVSAQTEAASQVETVDETPPLLPETTEALEETTPTTTSAAPQDPAPAPILPTATALSQPPDAPPMLPGETPPPVPDFFENNAALAPEPGLNDPASQVPQPSTEQLQAEARQQAFDAALQGILPLRPDEIRQLLEQFDRTQESVEVPVYPNPRPEVAVETISLDPGTKPSTIKVAYGNVTTLNILDASGAPWPIEDISWAGNFEIVEAGSGDGSHIIRISPQSEFAAGNISIRLLTLKTPVILSIETSRDMVHYRFDAIIPEYGPLAEVPLIEQGMITTTAGDANITSILQGIPPASVTRLDVTGVDGRTSAYRLGKLTYIRTPLTLLSPSWTSSVSSADGMNVYALNAAPVLLLSDNGKMVRARVAERHDMPERTAP